MLSKASLISVAAASQPRVVKLQNLGFLSDFQEGLKIAGDITNAAAPLADSIWAVADPESHAEMAGDVFDGIKMGTDITGTVSDMDMSSMDWDWLMNLKRQNRKPTLVNLGFLSDFQEGLKIAGDITNAAAPLADSIWAVADPESHAEMAGDVFDGIKMGTDITGTVSDMDMSSMDWDWLMNLKRQNRKPTLVNLGFLSDFQEGLKIAGDITNAAAPLADSIWAVADPESHAEMAGDVFEGIKMGTDITGTVSDMDMSSMDWDWLMNLNQKRQLQNLGFLSDFQEGLKIAGDITNAAAPLADSIWAVADPESHAEMAGDVFDGIKMGTDITGTVSDMDMSSMDWDWLMNLQQQGRVKVIKL